jgi:DNA polymerase-3 subunit alpha
MSNFVHLHLHDHYSLLDGIGTPPQVVAKAVELGMTAIAETNHGTCGGFFTFYNECVRNKVKPILGVEAYIVDNMRDKSKDSKQFRYHINLLAKNANGVKNIHRLITEANVEGFYYKPRIDFECLKKYKDDIIVLTACASGYIPALIHNKELGTKTERSELIEKRMKLLKDNFGSDLYFEIMPNEMHIQSDINLGLMELSNKYKVKLVATNDCHYVDYEDMLAHDTLLMIQSKTTITDPNRWKMEARKLHICTRNEMMIEFGANH